MMICVPVYNRLRIAEQCVPTITAGKDAADDLIIYDDGSSEAPSENAILLEACDGGMVRCENMRIDALRMRQFVHFWKLREEYGFTHLYLTDSDAPHDPSWRSRALALQEKYRAPVCLYRTKTHADYGNNIFRDDPDEDVIWQRFSPGVSLLLDIEMVAKIMKNLPERWAWDWHVASLLGYRMAVSRTSYCDHIDSGGLHSPGSGIGPERATNPTPYLATKRLEIIANLEAAHAC